MDILSYIMGQKSGSGGGGGATILVIYDADIVLEYQVRDNPYEGHFTPQTEPDTTQPVTIVLNGNTYTTLPPEPNDNYYYWEVDVDYGVIGLIYDSDSGQCHFGATENYLPSTEHEQTLPLKITQVQSGSGGGSVDGEFSTANVSIHNSTNEILTVGIPFVNEENIGCAVEFFPSEVDEEYTVPLYKGLATIIILYEDYSAVVTGSIYNDPQFMKYQFQITGDGTITIMDTDPD